MRFTILFQSPGYDPLKSYVDRVQGFRLESQAAREVVQALHRAYSAEDVIAATYAEEALIRLAPQQALAEFVLQIKRGAWSTSRGRCFLALAHLADWHPEVAPRVRAAVAEFIDSPNDSIASQAVYTLAEVEWKLDPGSARLNLERLLEHKNHTVRGAAARRLGEFGGHDRASPARATVPPSAS